MELKDVIEHSSISKRQVDDLAFIQDSELRMKQTISRFENKVRSLENLKKHRDNSSISDNKYFNNYYFRLFDLYIRDIEGFSKFVLNDNFPLFSKIVIRIFEQISLDNEYFESEGKHLSYNAYSGLFKENPILKEEDIISLERERKIFLFGRPKVEGLPRRTDLSYLDINKDDVIYSLSEDLDTNELLFKPRDFDFFIKYNKGIVKDLRHSLTDQDIDIAITTSRKIDFGKLKYDFRVSETHLLQKASVLNNLAVRAEQYRTGKTLEKRH